MMNSNYICCSLSLLTQGNHSEKNLNRVRHDFTLRLPFVFLARAFFFFFESRNPFFLLLEFEAILCFSFPFSFTCFEKWENPDIVPRQLGCRDQIENSN